MNGKKPGVPHCRAFSTSHSHLSWIQIFASGSCFQIPLNCIHSLVQDTMFHNHIAQLAILLFNILLFLNSSREVEKIKDLERITI